MLGIDKIWFGWAEFNVLDLATQSGTDVVIDYGAGSTLILQNIDLSDPSGLSAADFIFDTTPLPDPLLV